jgi:hypothetical protein
MALAMRGKYLSLQSIGCEGRQEHLYKTEISDKRHKSKRAS